MKLSRVILKYVIPTVFLLGICGFFNETVAREHNRDLVREQSPENFFNSQKYRHYNNEIEISFLLGKSADAASFSNFLFRIVSHKGLTTELMLNCNRAAEFEEIILIHNDRTSKSTLDGPLFESPEGVRTKIRIDFQDDAIAVCLGDEKIMFHNIELAVNDGYKFYLLPGNGSSGGSLDPVLSADDLEVWYDDGISAGFSVWWYWLATLIAVDIALFLRMRHLKRRDDKADRRRKHMAGKDGLEIESIELPRKSAIYLFGGLHIYNAEGENITKRFSPMLRELFAVIIMHSAGRGISSEKLREILWPDKSSISARNNRAVYMGKLRALLEELGAYTLSEETGYWKLASNEIFVDYFEFSKISFARPLSLHEVSVLVALSQHGNVLPAADYRWIDTFKAAISDDTIGGLWDFASGLDIARTPDLVIEIAQAMSRFESINEQSLYLKCKAYSLSGRHSTAKKEYDLFCEEYQSVYEEKFPMTFTELINKTGWDL